MSDHTSIIGFLFVMEGPGAGEIIKLTSGRNTIGTSNECDVKLAEESSSAQHASLRYENHIYTLKDLDSNNGTFVNGNNIVPHNLAENDVIHVGSVKMKFKIL